MLKKILCTIVAVFFILSFSESGTALAAERLNMAYLYTGTMNDYRTYIDRTKDSVDVILPNLFNINQDGSLQLTNVINKKFVDEMHSKGIKVIPYISNHWDRELGRKAVKNYVNYVDQVVKIVNEYNLDGVNIDIENLTEADADSLTAFTKYLRQCMPAGKTVSMAVAANPTNASTGWQGSYNFDELDKYVNMFVLMSYDQSYYGSKPGPVSGINFVESSIKVLLKYTTSDKIVMGVPFYGRYWNYSESVGGSAIINASVNTVKNAFYAAEYYDEYNQTPYLKYSVNKLQALTSVAGKKFSEGNYIMYFENDRSIKQKLILVEKYNLLGSAEWALSQEDTSVWKNYKNWLNAIYFNDINDSWAKEYIKQTTVEGYMNGSTIYSFKPEKAMTREEFAAVVCRFMGYDNIIVNGIYNDVKSNRWSFNYINTLYSYGIMQGSYDRFYPDREISREEAAAVIFRLLKGKQTSFNNGFSDVDSSMWSKKYIDYCVYTGIMEGYPDGTFKPHDSITREEIAALIMRLKQFL